MPIINSTINLNDLPLTPPTKSGWPWTEQTKPLPKHMPDGSEWPRISIITPSYNQGKFIEETIRSILLQGYPNLEYIIIDGGSRDKSVDIISKYEKWLAYWVSEPDKGQSNALNKGFRRATGKLIGWQNSDDYYQPTAFVNAAKFFSSSQDTDIFYGHVRCVSEDGKVLASPRVCQFEFENMLPGQCVFNQSMFFRKRIFDEGNFIDETWQHLMDYEFFWRLALKKYQYKFIPEISANFRRHSETKSSTLAYIATREFFEVYKLLYHDFRFPVTLRGKLLSSMLGSCLDSFGKLRLDEFRKNTHQLASISMLSILNPELVLKYLISFLGIRNLKMIKTARNKLNMIYREVS